MDHEDKKLLFSFGSITLFILLLVITLTVTIWSQQQVHSYVGHNKLGTVLLRTLSDQEYIRFLDKEYVDYASQDFNKLKRNNLHCNVRTSITLILKEKTDSICHEGICHIEIGCFTQTGEFIKYYE